MVRKLDVNFHRDLSMGRAAIPSDGRFGPAPRKDASARPGLCTRAIRGAIVCIPLGGTFEHATS